MIWLRRGYEFLSKPSLAILDLIVLGVLWGMLNSDHSHLVKGLVIVPVLIGGAVSFLFVNTWWRPKPKCEVCNCTNRAGGQTCATNLDGKQVFRLVCDDHWEMWRKPGGKWASASERDTLMEKWCWPGEAWWRD